VWCALEAAALTAMRQPDITVETFDQADVRFHIALVAASDNEAMHLIMLAVRQSIADHLLDALHQLPQSSPRCATSPISTPPFSRRCGAAMASGPQN
jgi:DNA-binding FadR family transcriptional regulator